MTTGARHFYKENILARLAEADERAREREDDLEAEVGDWPERIDFLLTDKCPISYLPVLCVLLTARAMREAHELDVFSITAKSSDKGYSSQAIGKRLTPFAAQCGIDLRSTSSQVMNAQPFTNEKFIVPGMAGVQYTAAYAQFYADAELVQSMTSEEALTVLAYIFHRRRGAGPQPVEPVHLQGGKETFDKLLVLTHTFVSNYSEQGKVGQAFAAALYDLLYGADTVRMGNNNDPSFGTPGDVQVGPGGHYWLWGEVKQKAITTSEVQTFMNKVQAVGGERIAYFALVNYRYPGQLNENMLAKLALRSNLDLTLYTSPEAALDELLVMAPGSYQQVASDFATRLTARLQEAQVTSALEESWKALLEELQ